MMNLSEYLKALAPDKLPPADRAWLEHLRTRAAEGERLFQSLNAVERAAVTAEFQNRVRTEEIKAWYSEREGESLFQGTSVSSLTIPAVYEDPIRFAGIEHLEELIAESYIGLHDRHEPQARAAILENVDAWMAQGLFYGVILSSKVIAQAFNLTVDERDILFDVDGVRVDPHEITSYSYKTREAYFKKCREKITCFGDLDLSLSEFEESLVLADISKPRLSEYRDRLILGPVRCNEICALISRRVSALICEKSQGRISPQSLQVGVYDSDTPYTYHKVAGFLGLADAPVLPGLTLLGTSGTIDAFRWLYLYRTSLLAQKLMKSSLSSEVDRAFVPFAFFGVLVERDAQILLDMARLGVLRYRGQISPRVEFHYVMPLLVDAIRASAVSDFATDLAKRTN